MSRGQFFLSNNNSYNDYASLKYDLQIVLNSWRLNDFKTYFIKFI